MRFVGSTDFFPQFFLLNTLPYSAFPELGIPIPYPYPSFFSFLTTHVVLSKYNPENGEDICWGCLRFLNLRASFCVFNFQIIRVMPMRHPSRPYTTELERRFRDAEGVFVQSHPTEVGSTSYSCTTAAFYIFSKK